MTPDMKIENETVKRLQSVVQPPYRVTTQTNRHDLGPRANEDCQHEIGLCSRVPIRIRGYITSYNLAAKWRTKIASSIVI